MSQPQTKRCIYLPAGAGSTQRQKDWQGSDDLARPASRRTIQTKAPGGDRHVAGARGKLFGEVDKPILLSTANARKYGATMELNEYPADREVPIY
jgi:hypothetical protein